MWYPFPAKEYMIYDIHITIVEIHNVRNTIMKFILTIALIAKTGLLTPEKVKGVPMDCAFAQTV